MKEQWKPVIGFEHYLISNKGEVKNKQGVIMKQQTTRLGYRMLILSDKKMYKNLSVHRIVAKAFVENPNGYLEVNHIDGNKLNNCYTNLEWCTRLQNLQHAITTGLRKKLSINKEKFPIDDWMKQNL